LLEIPGNPKIEKFFLMKKRIPLLLVLLVLLSASCKKETETDAQLVARRLQDVIRTESVVRVIPATEYVPGSGGGTITYGPDYGKTYQFNAPFVSIASSNYNLMSLKRYYISYVDSDKTLFLVF